MKVPFTGPMVVYPRAGKWNIFKSLLEESRSVVRIDSDTVNVEIPLLEAEIRGPCIIIHICKMMHGEGYSMAANRGHVLKGMLLLQGRESGGLYLSICIYLNVYTYTGTYKYLYIYVNIYMAVSI